MDAADLIVNNSATDLKNAIRITHKSFVPKNVIKRMQLLGEYRGDVDLHDALPAKLNAVEEQKDSQQGVQRANLIGQEDRPREIHECYCFLNIKGNTSINGRAKKAT